MSDISARYAICEPDIRGLSVSSGAHLRLEALWVVLVPSLKWISSKIADTSVQIVIGSIIAALATMFGVAIPGL
ncbi:MAG TPA: hypothetical protein VM620_15605 [Hyphomicrobium sp.]|nr:hypothetical protein [Hyphomicrobium sp.]